MGVCGALLCQGPYDALRVIKWIQNGYFDKRGFTLFRRNDEDVPRPLSEHLSTIVAGRSLRQRKRYHVISLYATILLPPCSVTREPHILPLRVCCQAAVCRLNSLSMCISGLVKKQPGRGG